LKAQRTVHYSKCFIPYRRLKFNALTIVRQP